MIAKTEDFIRKNIAGQKTKQAQSRRKMLDKLDRLERPEDVWATAERVAFRFAPAARTGDIVLDAQGARRRARRPRALRRASTSSCAAASASASSGPNGTRQDARCSSSSPGEARPEDRGIVKRGTNLQEGYFDQHLGDVDPRLTAVDNVRRVRGDFTVEAARQYLARFRFWGDDPLRVVSGFSGGERSRLALAKLLLEPRNLLFLDEPTNHLDIPAAEILEEALAGFEGTVILVSHDRRFLENVTTRDRARPRRTRPTSTPAASATTSAPSRRGCHRWERVGRRLRRRGKGDEGTGEGAGPGDRDAQSMGSGLGSGRVREVRRRGQQRREGREGQGG